MLNYSVAELRFFFIVPNGSDFLYFKKLDGIVLGHDIIFLILSFKLKPLPSRLANSVG